MPGARRFPEVSSPFIILVHGFANTLLGIAFMLWANPGAEGVLAQLFPIWLWPAMFMVAGILGFCGLASLMLARFAFVFAAIVMGVFACASAIAVFQGMLSAIPTTVFLFYLVILKFYVASALEERETVLRGMNEVTAKGLDTLQRVQDGTDTNAR